MAVNVLDSPDIFFMLA